MATLVIYGMILAMLFCVGLVIHGLVRGQRAIEDMTDDELIDEMHAAAEIGIRPPCPYSIELARRGQMRA